MRLIPRNRAVATLWLGMVVALAFSASQVLWPHKPALAQTDEPETWSLPINLSNSALPSWLPGIATDRTGNVHVVWTETVAPGWNAGSIFYTMRMREGTSWFPPVRISTDATENALLASIAVDSKGIIHVVYPGGGKLDGTPGHMNHRSAHAGGSPWLPEAWSDPVLMSDLPLPYWNDMAIDAQDNIYSVFEASPQSYSSNLYFTKSTDGGQTWSEATALRINAVRDWAQRPRVYIDQFGIIHVVWTNTLDAGVPTASFYMHSLDGGYTWSEATLIGQESSNWVDVIVDRQNVVHITWWGTETAYHQWSADGGSSWSEPDPVLAKLDHTLLGPMAGWPDMGLDSQGTLHVVTAAAGRPYHTWWGRGWALPVQITEAQAAANLRFAIGEQPAARLRFAISEGNKLHAVWFQVPSIPQADPGNWEIFYSTAEISAPHVKPEALPTPVPPAPTPTRQPRPTLVRSSATATPAASHTLASQTPIPVGPVNPSTSTTNSLAVVVVSLVGLFALVFLIRAVQNRRRTW